MNTLTIDTRNIILDGTCNCRDFGGLVNSEGRTVKRGKILRSDGLNKLSDEDLRTLSKVPLCTIIDLRNSDEMIKRPDRIPESVADFLSCTLDTPKWLQRIARLTDENDSDECKSNMLGRVDAKISTLTRENISASMVKLYEFMMHEPESVAVFRTIFEKLFRNGEGALLFHCAAGKDRTGIVAALILASLGVDEKTIIEDYMLSGIVVEKRYAKAIELAPSLLPLYDVSEEYIRASLDCVYRKHGNFERYFKEVIEIDPGEMKRRYLD